jgi:hypothetical protein
MALPGRLQGSPEQAQTKSKERAGGPCGQGMAGSSPNAFALVVLLTYACAVAGSDSLLVSQSALRSVLKAPRAHHDFEAGDMIQDLRTMPNIPSSVAKTRCGRGIR